MVKYMKNYTFPFNNQQRIYRVGTSEKTEMKVKLMKLFEKHNYNEIEKMFTKLFDEKRECIKVIKVMEEDIVNYKKEIDEFKKLKDADSHIDTWSSTELLEIENELLKKEVDYLHSIEINKLSDTFNKSFLCPQCSYIFKKTTIFDYTFFSNGFEKMKTSNGIIINLPSDDTSNFPSLLYSNEAINNDSDLNTNTDILEVDQQNNRNGSNFDNNTLAIEKGCRFVRKPYHKLTNKSQKRRNMMFSDMLFKKNGGEKLHISTIRHIIREMGYEKIFMPKITIDEIKEYSYHHKVSLRSIFKIKQIIEDKLQYKMFPETKDIKEIWSVNNNILDDSKMNSIFKSVFDNLNSYEYNQSEMDTYIDYSQFNQFDQ